jgi:release factor glutamine methyltransferase
MPTEYALGLGTFYGRTFYTESGALIPREETELLVDKALSVIKDRHSESERLIVVDMGTGSGSIAISIALNTIGTEFYASDINADTVRIAEKNIHKFNLEDRVTLLCGDKFEPYGGMGLEGHVDFVICNPPYIPSTSLKKMDSEIIDFEPEEAFNGGSFGIEFFRGLIEGSLTFLRPGGFLIFEIGKGQEKLVSRLFKSNEGYINLEFIDDGADVRVICAQRT